MSNVVIIGAGSGIGEQLAVQLYESDHNVLVLTRNTQKYDQRINNRLKVIYFDLEKQEDIDNIEATIQSNMSHVDVLINNAGFLVNKPFTEVTTEDLQRSYQINVLGIYQSIQGILPLLKAASHIVNISSMGGFQGASKFPGLSAYSPAKAALCSLTEILAEELKEKNIKVNCLALGAVQTEMLARAFPGYEAPLSADEMASYIAEFSINGSQFFNGKILPVSVSTP